MTRKPRGRRGLAERYRTIGIPAKGTCPVTRLIGSWLVRHSEKPRMFNRIKYGFEETMPSSLPDIIAALSSDGPIRKEQVTSWIDAVNDSDLQTLSKLYRVTGEGYYRIQPELGMAPTCALVQRYLIGCVRERHSRFAMLIRVRSKETEVVVAALSRHIRMLPAMLKRSLTWDRGLEMAKHKDFTVATDVQVYFCDPQSPWQLGTNENTNLLLRQYFPRGTDLSGYSQEQLDQVSLLLNQRPRKTLGFQTPADKLQASVASTA